MSAIHGILAGSGSDGYDPIVVTITPSSTSGTGGSTVITSGSVTATATGGEGTSYTFTWTTASSTTDEAFTTSPTASGASSGTTFKDILVAPGNSNATFTCTVDNGIGPSAPAYKNIYVTFTRT